jgi:acetyltransferase-like isoleucine patch superfamily enzyme
MHEIDPSAQISPLADLEISKRGSRLIIGPGSMIDAFVKVKFVGGSGDIRIGAKSFINSGSVLYSGNGITIGDDVLVAANCTFAPTNHAFADPDRPIREQGFLPSRGGIIIEDDVWIGANVVLLDGAIIRRGAIIAAGSVVRGEVASLAIVGGNPLRALGRRGEPTRIAPDTGASKPQHRP